MESWRKVWRAAAPLIGDEGLAGLKRAILEDDPRLIQGATCTPPPLLCCAAWEVETCCLLSYPGCVEMGGFGTATVEEVEAYFARFCFALDQAVGEPAGCRWLIGWFDDSPRDEVRRLLLPEIELEIQRREQLLVSTPSVPIEDV